MALKTGARIRETSITTGTGTYTLDGAPAGFQAFSTLGLNNLCPYFATDGTNWEEGIGTVLTAPNRLARTHVLGSSNAGAAVNWGIGSRTLRCGPIGALAVPRKLSKNVAGGVGTTVLTQDEQRYDIIEFTGALTGNRVIEVDATPWNWTLVNNTTGAFSLIVRVTGQTGIGIAQGRRLLAWCNGVDVVTDTSEVVNLRDFGDAGIGGDWTAILALAHATGKIVRYPAGVFNFSSLSLSDGGIVGDGRNKTILNCTDITAADIITYTGANNFPTFRDFQLAGSASKTAGSGLVFNPASGETHNASIQRVCFNQLPVCLDFRKSAFQSVMDCFFQTFNKGIILDNQNNGDGGDQYIAGNLFSTDTGIWPNAIAIQYKKGGGARIIGNKILGGQLGISMDADGNTNTSDLFITENSIENQTFAHVTLNRASGTITWKNILIARNQFAGAPNGVLANDADTFLSGVSITDNVFDLSVNANAIDIDRITGLYVGENVISGVSGNIGVRLGLNCVNGKIGKNTYNSVATTLSNSSPSVVDTKDIVVGNSSGVTGTGYGATLFVSAAVVVNFGVTFSVVPQKGDVTAHVSDGVGGGVAVMVTGVSATQATFLCIGVTNGGSVNFSWKATGII